MGPRRRRCYLEAEGLPSQGDRWSVQVQGPVGPGRPEDNAPVTTSTTEAADQAARSGWWPEIVRWRVKGHFIGECTRTR